MAKEDDMKNIWDGMKAEQRKINAAAKELEKGLGKQVEMQRDILRTKQDIAHIAKKNAVIEEQLAEDLKERKVLQDKMLVAQQNGDKKAKKAAHDRLILLRKEIKLKKESLGVGKEELKDAEKGLELMQESVKQSNLLKSSARSVGKAMKTWGWDKLKSWGVFEMDKAIRDSAKSMGVGAKGFESFSSSISVASEKTIMMGAGIKDLAKMQGGYSKEIGRSVRLTEEGMIAMAEMAEGTGLGAEYAIGMAAGMDDFGASVETSRDLVQETLDISGEMGVNSAAAAEGLKKSLKLAQRFHFKGGVKGLAKMANEAARLKLDMDGIAGLAEKVFRPEGAVEMAAKLQTMGGAFAQMADPMQLMFKARNDFEGFSKDIGKATSEFVEFNKEQGIFEVKGGLAADRMREISTITGIGVEKLQEMAVQQKKIEAIGSISPFNFDKDEKALVAGMADMKDGEWQVSIDGHAKLVKDLNNNDLKKLRLEQQNLDERAEQSRTFQDVMMDVWEQIQSILLPFAQALKKNLGGPIQKFIKTLSDGGKDSFIGSIKSWVKSIAGLVTSVGKWIIDNPIKSVLAVALFKTAGWIANGLALATGFNLGARMGGGMGMGRGMTGPGAGFGAARSRAGITRGVNGQMVRGRPGMSTGAKMGAGLGLGIAGMGLDYARSTMDDQESRGAKALGVGSSALTGAAFGMMLGPVGALVGGLAGAAYGAFKEYGGGDGFEETDNTTADMSSLYSKTSEVNDAIIKFNPRDKFTTVNDAIIASTSQNQLNTATKKLTGGDSNSETKVKIDDVKADFNFNFNGIDNEIGKMLLANNQWVNKLNTVLHEVSRTSLSYKISPQPI